MQYLDLLESDLVSVEGEKTNPLSSLFSVMF